VQHGQGESSGLAAAGHRARDQVPALQGRRNGLALDGRRLLEAELPERADELRVDGKGREGQATSFRVPARVVCYGGIAGNAAVRAAPGWSAKDSMISRRRAEGEPPPRDRLEAALAGAQVPAAALGTRAWRSEGGPRPAVETA